MLAGLTTTAGFGMDPWATETQTTGPNRQSDPFAAFADSRLSEATHLETDAVESVLADGEDPNIASEGHQYPLHTAQNAQVVDLLLNAGANPDVFDANGHTPLFKAMENLVNPYRRHRRNEYIEEAKLLLQAGANPNLGDRQTGLTPLAIALFEYSQNKNSADIKEIVILLLEAGANPNEEDFVVEPVKYKAPLLIKYLQDKDIVKMLLHAGANPNLDCRFTGTSPLAHAVLNNDIEAVGLLLEAGANYNTMIYGEIRDIEDLANKIGIYLNNFDIVRLIKEYKKGDDYDTSSSNACTLQ